MLMRASRVYGIFTPAGGIPRALESVSLNKAATNFFLDNRKECKSIRSLLLTSF
jgi:hypothetical protein